MDSRGRAEPHLAVSRKVFVAGTGSNWTEGRRNERLRSYWGGDSSLARAFESKHGHLQLRGNSRSSIEEPGQSTSIDY